MRVNATMECTTCKRRNYMTTKNRRTTTARLELKKYCRWCKGHILHRETR